MKQHSSHASAGIVRGKAGAWQDVYFRGKERPRYTRFRSSKGGQSTIEGFSPGPPENWVGRTKKPFSLAPSRSIPTSVQDALAQAGRLTTRRNPTSDNFFLLNGSGKVSRTRAAWRAIWGESQLERALIRVVDASTGVSISTGRCIEDGRRTTPTALHPCSANLS